MNININIKNIHVSLSIYICVCMYIHTYIYTYIYALMGLCKRRQLRRVDAPAYIDVYMHAYTRRNTYVNTCTPAAPCRCACIHRRVYACIYT